MNNEMQLELFDDFEVMNTSENVKKHTTTFKDNMSLPIHRWFRYSAGFSAEWVEDVIRKFNVNSKNDFKVFDPFVGSGTVLLASDKMNVLGVGTEAHPFVSKMTRAKLKWHKINVEKFLDVGLNVLEEARGLDDIDVFEEYNELIYKCYSKDILQQLTALKKTILKLNPQNEDSNYELVWLALVAILRPSSSAGTAQWQYILPNNKKSKVKVPFEAFEKQILLMAEDIRYWQKSTPTSNSKFLQEDCRNCPSVKSDWADLVITSPPYANNYDYADATRLEMSFFNEIKGWSDLQSIVRQYLIRSCTQQVSKEKNATFELIKDEILKPIYVELESVCRSLDLEKEKHGGKKNYHTMIALYFLDLANVWKELRRICKDGSNVCFVIGDSAPYGIYVPVDKWLGELALSAGFKEYYFEKVRDRNTKWKNRKHTVPLKEGYLWVKG
ncbi:hypothetical protein [Paenibacillus campi]|uniref:hypothetical protein n=1 Tax=Paenibacillus campi TaxID=3106031 RepID=UPI002AFF345F|nr:hypothetical protein [Paenibacillus sp. SGZ-1014]